MTEFLRYDGTFEGFLSAAAASLRSEAASSVLRPAAQIPLLPVREVETEAGLADRLGTFFATRLGPEVPTTVYQAWLSRLPGIEDAIVAYLRLGLARRRDPSGFLQDASVAAVVKASRKVTGEAHFFLGVLRFRLRGSLYLAEIEPAVDVLPLIGDHFSQRFHDQSFAIHDLTRGRAILHPAGGAEWEIVDVPSEGVCGEDAAGSASPADEGSAAGKPAARASQDLPERPDAYEAMWKRYFQAMAIEERRNPTCQRNFLPKKYWRHLVEEPGTAGRRAAAGRV
jgi:probable DNA metabolism protein